MTQAKRIYTCDCGYQWQEGRSGPHDCAAGYKRQRDALFHTAMRVIKGGHNTSSLSASLDDLRQVTHEIAPIIFRDTLPPLYSVHPATMVRGHAMSPELSWGAGVRMKEEKAQVEDMIMRGISDPKQRAQLLEDMGQ